MGEKNTSKINSKLKLIIPIIAGYVVFMGIISFLLVTFVNNGTIVLNGASKGENLGRDVETVSVSDDVNDGSGDNGSGKSNDTDADDENTEVANNIEDKDNKEDTDNKEESSGDNSDSDDSKDDTTANNDADKNDSDDNSIEKPPVIGDAASYSNSAFSKERLAYISNLSLEGDGYEGTKGTGKYNYGEALQKSLLFYELQRSGKLPDNTRTNWRGDSCLNDGADVGLDLTGGLYDAGDHVKFNLPMAYTAAMLGWSVIEDEDAYEESGQKEYALNNIKFICDYLIKCHPEDEVYYYQVGDGGADHSWWGPCEVLEARMSRPSYKVTANQPGSCVTGEAAAALAVASIVFEKEDAEYSKLCLAHAKSLYDFADKYKSDAGYTAANGFYTSWSGFYDELTWASAWLYKATGEKKYLNSAKEYFGKTKQDIKWTMCWDDVTVGSALFLANETGDKTFTGFLEQNLDYWTVGSGGQKINYSPKGLAWLDNWGSLRYATTAGYIAAVYSESKYCPKDKKSTYWDFAVSQADYALGSTGRSFVCGFGENPPVHPHHRTSQGSYANDMNNPSEPRHVLVGALVGGPDAGDSYNDTVSDFNKNEVACDYNAGYTALLAKLYTKYKGQTIKNLGAVEIPGDEIYSEASINVNGQDFVEIKAFVYNTSAWPARVSKDVELRYFIDLSEIFDAGGSENDIEITTNYIQDASSGGLAEYDKDKHIYYVAIGFNDGALYPGGQESYKKEVQFRIRSKIGTWENSNDYSFEGLTNGNLTPGKKLAVYEGGKLVYGSEP